MRLLIALLVASSAWAGPRMQPFLEPPGQPLGAGAIASAFCETSQRAIVRIAGGDVLAIDAYGTQTKVASSPPYSGPIACDRKNRIIVGAGRSLVIVDGMTTTQESLPADIRHLRVLADDSIGIVDAAGGVHRWSGGPPVATWSSTKIAVNQRQLLELDDTGDRLLVMSAGRIAILDATGKTDGPRAAGVTWLDGNTLLVAERTGAIGRWKIGTKSDPALIEQIYTIPDLPSFGASRINLQKRGRRILAEPFSGPLRTVVLDAKGDFKAAHVVTRIPNGFRHVAAGETSRFATLAVGDRVLVVELDRSYAATDPSRPMGIVTTMAFSPDGRSLAFVASTERDIIVATIDRARVIRLPTKQFLRGPMRWASNGTLLVNAPNQLVRWNLDGTMSITRASLLGFTPIGDPITFVRGGNVAIERATGEQTFTLPQATRPAHEADGGERVFAVRGTRRCEVFAYDGTPVFHTKPHAFIRAMALVGESLVYVDDVGGLHFAGASGARKLADLDRVAHLETSPDHKRVAVASKETVEIYDDRGTKLFDLPIGAPVHSLAWSPDLRTLAVASRGGIALWTVPR